MVQIVREASRVVLDPAELESLAAAAGLPMPKAGGQSHWSWKNFSDLSTELTARYGQLGARGTALKVGRAAFQGVVRTYGSAEGFEEQQYQLLPVRKRARAGLEKLAAIFDCACGMRVTVTAEPDAWLWTLAECEECNNPAVEAMVSHFMLGLLQAYLAWISGGKVFQVEEIACRADGAPDCVIRVLRNPLD
ncbi:MAG TPA: hypothetical protein VN364_06295 [Bellilinea sp.]|nr:hypothetical protein [Bellilinea sp.]